MGAPPPERRGRSAEKGDSTRDLRSADPATFVPADETASPPCCPDAPASGGASAGSAVAQPQSRTACPCCGSPTRDRPASMRAGHSTSPNVHIRNQRRLPSMISQVTDGANFECQLESVLEAARASTEARSALDTRERREANARPPRRRRKETHRRRHRVRALSSDLVTSRSDRSSAGLGDGALTAAPLKHRGYFVSLSAWRHHSGAEVFAAQMPGFAFFGDDTLL